jgi:exosome complex exonuclease RRP6
VSPAAGTSTAASTSTVKVEIEQTEAVAGQVEMPFVPANERQQGKRTVVEETVKDSIVVVGQAQRKKRKRIPGAKAVEKTDGDAPPQETLDYSSVSNILDEGSDHEPEVQGGRKRRQKTQGTFCVLDVCADCSPCSSPGRFDYGNFRAPPKAHSEVKSGNQSRTFK